MTSKRTSPTEPVHHHGEYRVIHRNQQYEGEPEWAVVRERFDHAEAAAVFYAQFDAQVYCDWRNKGAH